LAYRLRLLLCLLFQPRKCLLSEFRDALLVGGSQGGNRVDPGGLQAFDLRLADIGDPTEVITGL
jgi:hypothetical protein